VRRMEACLKTARTETPYWPARAKARPGRAKKKAKR
jgi:hypothetical protein